MLQVAFHAPGQHFQLRFPDGKATFHEVAAGWEPLTSGDVRGARRSLTCQLERGKLWLKRRGLADENLPGEVEVTNPARVAVEGGWFEFALTTGHASARSLETIEPVAEGSGTSPFKGPASATLKDWFDTLSHLNRLAASSGSFALEAAEYVRQAIRLDGVILLARNPQDKDEWQVKGSSLPNPELGLLCPFELLDRVKSLPRTWFHGKPTERTAQGSPTRDEIIAPLLDADGNLLGALYGYRVGGRGNRRRGLRHLEARLFELLAQSVAVAIERAERERLLAEQRVCLERSFPPAVLRQLSTGVANLKSSEREVTLLMADLRGFTSLCQHVSTEGAHELLNEVMDSWTDCVMNHGGTLIDYYGDGLAAMWNAPADQPDHATLAVRGAMEMVASLPVISTRWKNRLREPLGLGIGIHTGRVQVGNVGTSRQLKYGPRGIAVNLASRVEGATKGVGTDILLTKSAARRVSSEFPVLRVCQAQVKGFAQPVDLYIVFAKEEDPILEMAATAYREALALFELGDLEGAGEALRGCPGGLAIPADFLRRRIDAAVARRMCRRQGDTPGSIAGAPIPLLG